MRYAPENSWTYTQQKNRQMKRAENSVLMVSVLQPVNAQYINSIEVDKYDESRPWYNVNVKNYVGATDCRAVSQWQLGVFCSQRYRVALKVCHFWISNINHFKS